MIEQFLSGMNLTWVNILFVFVLLAGTWLMVAIGRWYGARQLANDPEISKSGTGVVDGAVFGLMGLLLGFTFSHAASSFDTRRELVVEEANCIGTAWLRLDLLPKANQPALRDDFRKYVDSRISAFRKVPDMEAVNMELTRGAALQQKIWTQATETCNELNTPHVSMLLLPAINQMFDIANTRTQGAKMHPPVLIYGMLLVLVLSGSLLAGHGMGLERVRSWLHALLFVAVTSIAIFVIFDFEHPRIGLIRIDTIDQVLVELQESLKP